ncbi:MAG TPA: peptidoglycan-binding protein, partial [Fibrella sp.]
SVKSSESQPVKLEVKPIITPDPLPTPGTRPKSKPAEAKATEAKPDEKVTEPKAPAPRVDDEPVAAVRKANVKSEIGFADMIEGNDPSTKYLALHRSAPIGTLVQVRNDITNQSLYVKVIGKLPDTGLNNQVLIRLSGRAFEKLSPNGQRFRAEVSYTN